MKLTQLLIYLMLFSFGSTSIITSAAPTQEQSEAQLKQLKSNISKVNRWLTRANKEKTGLSAELEKHERSINKISKTIRHDEAQISVYSKELGALNNQQKVHKKELKKHQKFLAQQLKTAYLYGEQPDLKILLNSENPQTLALDMHYFAAIKDAQNAEIKEVQSTLEKVRSTEKKITAKKLKLNQKNIKLKQEKEALKNAQKKKLTTLKKLKQSIASKQAKLKSLKNNQKRLESLLSEIEQAITDIPLPDDAAPFSKRKGKLPWPVKGKTISRFGSRILQGKIKRNGIHIATKDNQEVKAVHSGRIVFSNWIRGFGLLIIVDHGNNYMSLYGNNKSLAKETGDWVRANEVIAFAQESSTDAESGLYFEIRKHGKPINPTRWLRK